MSYSDPDIQDAPIYPVSFEIEQDGHTVLAIDPHKSFIIKCAIYVPEEMKQALQQQEHFLYATIFANKIPIAQQIATIDPDYNPGNKFLQLAIDFSINDYANSDEINFQMAITGKHQGEMGIGESLRVGRFINTFIPLESSNEQSE